MRKILVTLQFAITSFLLIGAFVISNQISFMQNKGLGFDKEKILLLKMPGDQMAQYYEPLRNELLANPRVNSVTVAGGRLSGDTGNVPILAQGHPESVNLPINSITEDYFKTLGISVLAGREFNYSRPADTLRGVILNQQAAEQFDWTPKEALGKSISVSNIMDGEVIGVVDNFHYTSLHNQVQPLVMYYPRTLLQDIYVRVTPGNVVSLLNRLEKNWNNINPEIPFDPIFLDDHLNTLYQQDIRFANLVNVFSGVTILIAILGLYSLISVIYEYRIKEVGVRKVLGASWQSISVTLSRPFILLILWANLVSWPLIYYASDQWISMFAYRIGIKWEYFVIVLGLTLLISIITLLTQTKKVAGLDPVDVLRNE